MKALKRVCFILVVVVIVLPILAYIGIVIANNSIADQIEKELVAHVLPTSTERIDTISIAGKLTGNGNGMQYMGSLLVESDLNEEELTTYYRTRFDYVEVYKQETPALNFVRPGYSFQNFPETAEESYYSITCWDSAKRAGWITTLLDFDIRGH